MKFADVLAEKVRLQCGHFGLVIVTMTSIPNAMLSFRACQKSLFIGGLQKSQVGYSQTMDCWPRQ